MLRALARYIPFSFGNALSATPPDPPIDVRLAQRKAGYTSAYDIAVLYAGLGEKDEVFRWLTAAYEERDYQMESLRTDFRLDPVRSDPRFAELVRKVGLPQS